MRVVFLGTGVAIPYNKKAQSSILIDDGVKILVDVGIGALLRLNEIGVNVSEIDAVCITHHHLDHNGDLLNLLKARWLLGCDTIDIFGPRGTVNHIESLLEAYPYLRRKLKFRVFEDDEFKIEGLRVKTVRTQHSIESRGYIIDDCIAISGDTKPIKDFIGVECDLMIHEMSLTFGYEARDHTTPESLKPLLKYCKAERIYLTHMYPMAYRDRDKILNYLEFDTVIAEDLMEVKLR